MRYNPSTGIFKWKKPGYGRRISSKAGYKNKSGYIQIMHNKKLYQAHRLAWLYMEGYFPEFQIDHRNKIRHDNRWENLRHVSPSCNAKNSSVNRNSKSGVTGVSRRTENNLWVSMICPKGKRIYLGSSVNLDVAVKLRYEAELKYNWFKCQTDSSAYKYLKERNLL